MLLFLLKVATKLSCRNLFFQFLSLLYRGQGQKIFCDQFSAESFMENLYTDRGESSMANNTISAFPEFDLLIVVPVYNVERFLEPCMDSLVSQKTKYKWHACIIDDGSTDSSSEILNKYKLNPNITIIKQKNKGLSGARNAALNIIKANYVMFLDSDDVLLEGCIESLLTKAYEGNYDIVEGGYLWFDENGILRTFEHESLNSCQENILHGQVWAKLYKASLFRKTKFPEGYWFEDTINVMILFREVERVATISNVIYGYRKNCESIMSSFKKNYKTIDTYWVTRRLLEDAKRLNLPMDEKFYEIMMIQLIVNGKRLNSLGDMTLLAAYLVASKGLMRKYFGNRYQSKNGNGQLMESILNQCDYKKMRLAIMFKWDDL